MCVIKVGNLICIYLISNSFTQTIGPHLDDFTSKSLIRRLTQCLCLNMLYIMQDCLKHAAWQKQWNNHYTSCTVPKKG